MNDMPLSAMPSELEPSLLRRTCTDEDLVGATKPLNIFDDLFIGVDQGRLLQALELGLHDSSKSHIFVAGLSGPQALDALKSFVMNFLKSKDKKSPEPKDWCYIYNFDDSLQPIAIALEHGKGKRLKERLEKILADLQEKIPAALTREDMVHKRQQINIGLQIWGDSNRREIIRGAKQDDILVLFEKGEAFVNPISKKTQQPSRRGKEKPPQFMGPDELETHSPEEQDRLRQNQVKWLLKVQMHFVELTEKSTKATDATIEVNREAVRETVKEIFDRLLTVRSSKNAESYVEKLKTYTVEHYGIFDRRYQQQHQQQAPHDDLFLPWKVNVYVDNSEQSGPPVVVEPNGTFQDFVGRIERVGGGHGLIYTDHTKIGAGSVQRANGGYLIIDAMSLLQNQSYPVLKRILNNEIVKTEEYSSFLGVGSTVPLQPRPIPLNVKVILAGSRSLWSMFAHHDPEFFDHFDIKAEISPIVDWTPQEASALSAWTKRYAQIQSLVPPDKSALKRIIEHSSRMADSSKSLSTDYGKIDPVLREASFLAEKEKAPHISVVHVRSAIDRKFYRSSLAQEYRQRMIRDRKILLPLKGEAVGQITIMSVNDFGDMMVGFPGRVTVQWSMGKPGFLSIHKEAGLGGDILKKAELTVQSHLLSMFAKKYPFSVAVSYTKEQVYGMVDGDSASIALFVALLSALSGIAIRQDIAITGSLSLFGEPQPIGGANEKIEGFFESCSLTGLTGTQGIIIPRSNLDELMLNERVVEAVENHMFHLWPINNENEVIRILMGKDAGKLEENYAYTPGSVYDVVDKKLFEVARNARQFFSENPSSAVVS
ncbi:MAG: ATP-binding protein [bacterium]|nr:ATP-binding protein [bacterium]